MTSSITSSKKKKKNSSSVNKEEPIEDVPTNNITQGRGGVVGIVEEKKFVLGRSSSSSSNHHHHHQQRYDHHTGIVTGNTNFTISKFISSNNKNTNNKNYRFFFLLVLGFTLPILYNFFLVQDTSPMSHEEQHMLYHTTVSTSNLYHHPLDTTVTGLPAAKAMAASNSRIPNHHDTYHPSVSSSSSDSSYNRHSHKKMRYPNTAYSIHSSSSASLSSSSSSSSMDPYLIHMTRSISDDHHQASTSSSSRSTTSPSTSSSNAKSRINSSTPYYGGGGVVGGSDMGSGESGSGVIYPSYKYYYYDVYSQSFRLYPQPWDTEYEDVEQDLSTLTSTSTISTSTPSFYKGLFHDLWNRHPTSSTASSSTTTSSSSSSTTTKSQQYPPTLCNDRYTYGYSDWITLRNAIHERNYEYQKYYSRWHWYENAWSEYEMIQFLHPTTTSTTMMTTTDHQNLYPSSTVSTTTSTSNGNYNKDSSSSSRASQQHHHHHHHHQEQQQQQEQHYHHHRPWIEPPQQRPSDSIDSKVSSSTWKPFVICPGAYIHTPRKLKLKYTSIFINTESLEIKCTGCIWHGIGSHFTFGPQAKNVWIRGITFTGATTSSLLFPYHGSEVNFLRCNWFHNRGYGTHGPIMDVVSARYV